MPTKPDTLCLECGHTFARKPRYLLGPFCPACKSMDVEALHDYYSTLAEYQVEWD